MSEHDSFLNRLIGFDIKVVYPGPNTLKGLLVKITGDYLVLKDNKDIIQYLKLEKIKEITKSTKDIKPQNIKDIPVFSQKNFLELLKVFENSWLTVSRDGAEVIEGYLNNVSIHYITLVVKDKITLIPISQIAMLSIKPGMHPVGQRSHNSSTQIDEAKDNKVTSQPEKETKPIRFTKDSSQDDRKNSNAEIRKQLVKIDANEVLVKSSKEKSNSSLDKFSKPQFSNEFKKPNTENEKNRIFSTTKRQPKSEIREEKTKIVIYQKKKSTKNRNSFY